MVTVILKVNTSPEAAQGVKEALAMYLEQYGDVRVVSIHAETPEQYQFEI